MFYRKYRFIYFSNFISILKKGNSGYKFRVKARRIFCMTSLHQMSVVYLRLDTRVQNTNINNNNNK